MSLTSLKFKHTDMKNLNIVYLHKTRTLTGSAEWKRART